MIFFSLAIATLCGGLIGFQRQAMDRPAGLRTHILVCVGSAIYMLISVAAAGTQFDPTRIAAQVATGIGFLGAGTIIKQGSIVRGLTTAASIWAVAAIGLAAGFGASTYAIAFIGTALVLFALTIMRQVETHLNSLHRGFDLVITVRNPRHRFEEMRALFTAKNIDITVIGIEEYDGGIGEISLSGHAPTTTVLDLAISEVAKCDGVRRVERTDK
jgi:putative Mg2+ transporter-C (MgtC) family protein